MAEDILLRLTLAVIIGTLAAIVYSLRVLVLMERSVKRIELHIDNLAQKILKNEQSILSKLKTRKTAKKSVKKRAKKKTKRKR
jgi:uncharacterized membrane protein YgaE (UPF0421/DUF939 family)